MYPKGTQSVPMAVSSSKAHGSAGPQRSRMLCQAEQCWDRARAQCRQEGAGKTARCLGQVLPHPSLRTQISLQPCRPFCPSMELFTGLLQASVLEFPLVLTSKSAVSPLTFSKFPAEISGFLDYVFNTVSLVPDHNLHLVPGLRACLPSLLWAGWPRDLQSPLQGPPAAPLTASPPGQDCPLASSRWKT